MGVHERVTEDSPGYESCSAGHCGPTPPLEEPAAAQSPTARLGTQRTHHPCQSTSPRDAAGDEHDPPLILDAGWDGARRDRVETLSAAAGGGCEAACRPPPLAVFRRSAGRGRELRPRALERAPPTPALEDPSTPDIADDSAAPPPPPLPPAAPPPDIPAATPPRSPRSPPRSAPTWPPPKPPCP
jgi:hypothetical protein